MPQLGIDVGGTSVKIALVQAGKALHQAQSSTYARPDANALIGAIREVCVSLPESPDGIGLCVPGLLNADRTRVVLSVNVPGLMELPLVELVQKATGLSIVPVVTNDAIASGYDLQMSQGLKGRLLAIAIGTGVGAAVLDDGKNLEVEGTTPGHLGQIDVSLSDDAPIGPDGGRGSLEAYMGVPAIKRLYGEDVNAALAGFNETSAPLLALARCIRIAHAIYRPDHVALLGGIGIRLKDKLPILKQLIDENLTSVARADYSLTVGTDDYHAARGAGAISVNG